MQHAIILAHPKSTSLCATLARAYAAAAEDQGDAVILRDLYAADFDPRLQAGEVPDISGYTAAPDVVAERALIRDADVFCLVYPFWFNAPPAILKGYVDRVLSADFGYRLNAVGAEPLLTGRKLFSISTSGAPDRWIDQTGALRGLVEHFDTYLAAMTGMTQTDHVHFGGVVAPLSAEDVAEMVTDVRKAVAVLSAD